MFKVSLFLFSFELADIIGEIKLWYIVFRIGYDVCSIWLNISGGIDAFYSVMAVFRTIRESKNINCFSFFHSAFEVPGTKDRTSISHTIGLRWISALSLIVKNGNYYCCFRFSLTSVQLHMTVWTQWNDLQKVLQSKIGFHLWHQEDD